MRKVILPLLTAQIYYLACFYFGDQNFFGNALETFCDQSEVRGPYFGMEKIAYIGGPLWTKKCIDVLPVPKMKFASKFAWEIRIEFQSEFRSKIRIL